MKKKRAAKFCCPFCGHMFPFEESGCGGKCGLLGNCGLRCCPRCGYAFAPESKMVGLLKNLLKGTKEKEPEP